MRFTKLLAAVALCALAACATPYQSSGTTGGSSDKELEPGIWRVVYGGNGYTSRETVQVYWLYHSAELALAKGYDGFEILSDVRFVGTRIEVAAGGAVYVPIYTGDANKPSIEGDIRLLKQPIDPAPPKIFSARPLKEALERHVTGEKCSLGNVCPHVHRYLLPNDRNG
jgi:hypothetical protein